MKSLLFVALFTVCVQAEVPLISVSGAAEKSVDPNIVNVQIEVWGRATSAKSAQEAVAREYGRIKNVVEKFKIKKEDFETMSYNLNPEMDYNHKGGARPIGYRASHNLSVVLRKVDDAGPFIDALSSQGKVENGGVNIHNIGWDYDKRSQAEFSLLAEAVKDAKKQADELARASNVKIKGPYRISHSAEPGPILTKSTFRLGMAEAASSTEVSTGAVKIKVQVQADYQIQ